MEQLGVPLCSKQQPVHPRPWSGMKKIRIELLPKHDCTWDTMLMWYVECASFTLPRFGSHAPNALPVKRSLKLRNTSSSGNVTMAMHVFKLSYLTLEQRD